MNHEYHIVIGNASAKALKAFVADGEEIITLLDLLSEGPLQSTDIPQHDSLRSAYMSGATGKEAQIEDLANVLKLSTTLNNYPAAKATIWMGSSAVDIIAYYFLLHYLAKHIAKIRIVNISNLPFLDEEKKLFFPESVAELSVAELTKALKLSRIINAVDLEIDGGKYAVLKAENSNIRTRAGGGKIVSEPHDFYDAELKTILASGGQVAAALRKMNADVSIQYLRNRISFLGKEGMQM